MRRIIDFLIKNIHSLTFTFLLSFSLIQIIDKNFYHNSKFNFYSNTVINTINDFKQNFSEYFELKIINENLIIENTLLKNNSINTAKNDSIISDENYTYIPAKIISNSIKFSKNFITINKGINQKINVEDGVISKIGVIGIINNNSDKFSTVISILNTDLKINAKVKNTNHFGSLSWDANNFQIMNLDDVPKSALIKNGDTIQTGGMSSIFPEDIPSGTIIEYSLPDASNYYKIKVKLFEDIGSVNNVYVVKNNFKQEIKDLEKSNEKY